LMMTRIMFVVDSSGSVTNDAFRNQIEIANAVLDDVRKLFTEYKQDPRTYLSVGMIEFAESNSVRRPLSDDDGSNFDVDRRDICPLGAPGVGCGTYYEQVLTEVISQLNQGQDEDAEKLIWFLTDGQPIKTAAVPLTREEVLEMRKRLFKTGDNITIASTFLSPNDTSLAAGTSILQALSCEDPNAQCTDRVLAGSLQDPNFLLDKFKTDAQKMFRNVVKNKVLLNGCVNPLVYAAAFPLVAVIIGIIACTMTTAGAGMYAKKQFFDEEEEGTMQERKSDRAAVPTARYIGSASRRPHGSSYRNRPTRRTTLRGSQS